MTTVLGIRLNTYQRDHLKRKAEECGLTEVETVRILIDRLIEGKIHINCTAVEGVDIKGLIAQAEKRRVGVQTLIDAIVEQLNESGRTKRK